MQAVQRTTEHTVSAVSHPSTMTAQHDEATEPVAVPAALPGQEQQEDWSFAELTRSETHWGPHGYHRYPAKFIPHLVRRIIDQYSQPGDLVADPFLGSATTGVEALRAGRRFYGSDISPVAALISQAKCMPLPPAALDAAWKHLNRQLNSVPRVGKRQLTNAERQAIEDTNIAHASPTSDERFHYWFPLSHRNALEQILNAVKALEHDDIRTFYLCAFSNVLRGCSIWLSGSTKAQKDLNKTLADPADAFRWQVGDMLRRNKLYWQELEDARLNPATAAARHTVTVADARRLPLADASIDLLLTSPPYSTCYEYAELHQLTRLWFERYDLIAVEAGSHQAYIGSKGVSGPVGLDPTPQPTSPTATAQTADNGAPAHRTEPVPSTGSVSADAAIALLEAKRTEPGGKNKSLSREVRALRRYFEDMRRAIAEAARVVAPNKYMVLVIGDTKKRGITIPTSDALTELALQVGFTRERKIVREIPARILTATRDQTTGRFSATATSDARAYPEEDILVLRRVGTQGATSPPVGNGHRHG